MKKLNLICASIAVLFAAGAAQAGIATSTPNTVAVENFGGSTSSATDAVAGAPISYSMSGITAINSGATVYFTIRLTGGTFAAVPTGTFQFAGASCTTLTATTCTASISTDGSTMKVAILAGTNFTLGLGAFSYTPAAGDIVGVNSTLATVGGAVSASIGLTSIDPGNGAALNSTVAQSTVDTPLATGNLVVAAKGINGTVAASAYTGKIDLTASPAGSAYTTTKAVLGQVTFKNATATPLANQRASTVTQYTLAAGSANTANTGVTITVTPGAGQAFAEGSVLELDSNVTCSAALAGQSGSGTVAFTATTKFNAATITTTTPVADSTPIFVCMSAPGVGKVATPIQASLSASVTPGSTKDLITVAVGGGYSLGYNGSQVDVVTYWPGKLESANTGFKGYLRITNTGSVAAGIAAQQLSPTDGSLVGVSTGLNIAGALPGGILAAGQVVLLSTKQIDDLIGANPSGFNSGRIRITAPTNGLRVQSFMQSGAGDLIEYPNNPN